MTYPVRLVDKMSNLIDSKLIRKIEALSINPNLTSDKGQSGQRKSKGHGSSVEFSDFREYFPGDDVRKVDWNIYGKFEKLFIKLFEEEREVLFNIIIDNSKSMDFGSPSKLECSKKLGAILSYIILNNDDRLIIHYLDNMGMKTTSSFKGKQSFFEIVKILDAIEVSDGDLSKNILNRDFKRGIVMYLSDFYDQTALKSIKYLNYMGQRPILLQILSHEELNPREMGEVRIVDSEDSSFKNIKLNSRLIEAYKEKMNDFIETYKLSANSSGGYHLLVASDLSIDEILFNKMANIGLLR